MAHQQVHVSISPEAVGVGDVRGQVGVGLGHPYLQVGERRQHLFDPGRLVGIGLDLLEIPNLKSEIG
jgi:hypothetical protein